jgi:hypothetical protein
MATFTAVSYIKVGGASVGAAFGPEFSSEDAAWRWLHDLGDTPCQAPPHDYIEVEVIPGF